MDAAAIITAVTSQLGTDASRATVLSLLNECYSEQCADARWFRTEASIGTTTAGTADYAIPATIVQAYGLRVDGYPYEPVGEDEMWRLQTATATATIGRGGLFATTYDSSGNTQVTLYPTPQQTGDTIKLYAAVQPTALTDSGSSNPVTPADTHGSLINGTCALVLERIDERPELAAVFRQKFEVATEQLRRRKNSLLRGGMPMQAQVQGIHW